MSRVYKRPPLIEALCEFRFDPGSPWDVTIFGHYYDRVKDEFPQKQQMPQVEMSLGKRQGGMMGEIRETGTRMRFVRPDSAAMVQLAPHLLVVNKLPPYESWGGFKTLILTRLADYQAAVGAMPLKQVGLRYINRFDFSMEGFFVGATFASSEFLPVRLRSATSPFFFRLEMPQGGQDRLLLTMGTIETEFPEQVSVLLDLDYQIVLTTSMDQASLSAYLGRAHDRIEEVFESCLTERLREHFDAEG